MRNSFEEKIAIQLQKAGKPFKYEANRIPYTVPAHIAHYIPDFVLDNGIYIETKGRFTMADRRKHVLLHNQYPDLDIRFVFMRDDRIRKGSKTMYSDWCNKHHFKFSLKVIPEEWINELN